jgi:hypothetical protein
MMEAWRGEGKSAFNREKSHGYISVNKNIYLTRPAATLVSR